MLREHIIKRFSRHKDWPKVRKAHLKKYGFCAICGAETRLEVHHIIPVRLFPSGELDPYNLITLCMNRSRKCHFVFGHVWNWKKFNVYILTDARVWSHRRKH